MMPRKLTSTRKMFLRGDSVILGEFAAYIVCCIAYPTTADMCSASKRRMRLQYRREKKEVEDLVWVGCSVSCMPVKAPSTNITCQTDCQARLARICRSI